MVFQCRNYCLIRFLHYRVLISTRTKLIIFLTLWLSGTLYFTTLAPILNEINLVHDVRNGMSQIQAKVGSMEGKLVASQKEFKRLVTSWDDLEEFKRVRQVRSTSKRDSAIAVLVIACNRPSAIRVHLEKLLRLRPSPNKFPIIVSQDCNHGPTRRTIEKIVNTQPNMTYIQQPDQSTYKLPKAQKKFLNYYKISRHYKFALSHAFDTFRFKTVIVTEDDLDISDDFYDYFLATSTVLKSDPTLWCVSAWNDNGKAELIDLDSPQIIYRSDFFPGLGWMLTADVWAELRPKWPAAFWDDWMREPAQRQDRACLRPEVSRTSMSRFGREGVSKGLWYDQHLKHIHLNEKPVKFGELDLSPLAKEAYDPVFTRLVYDRCTVVELSASNIIGTDKLPAAQVRIPYRNPDEFHQAAKAFNLMNDFRSGVSRTGYLGIVPFMHRGIRVFLAPPSPEQWHGYDPKWN